MPANLKSSLLLSIIVIFLFASYPLNVKAVGSCSASVSPSSAETNSATTFNFSITNTGDLDINYINVGRPLSGFNLFNIGGIPGPWEANITTSQTELYNSALTTDSTLNFSVGANVGSSEGESGSWTIETNAGGCSGGPFTVSVSGASDTNAPVLSEPSVTSVSDSSATISWTSDEPADSTLNYGTEYGVYAESKNDATLKLSHSLTLTGLSANTAYYYEFKGADGSGNSTPFYDYYTFTTAKAASATTTTTVTTTTTTSTPAPTSTTTSQVKDTTPPSISLSTDFSEPFEEAPEITGRASDNRGVVLVEYSLDGGRNWTPIDNNQTSSTKLQIAFSFQPPALEDGNYELLVRAKDAAGNIGVSRVYTLVIDRLPPQVGGSLFSVGPVILSPDAGGRIHTIVGLSTKVTLSAIGGPVSLDLFANGQMYSFVKNIESGLWSGTVNIAREGEYKLKTKSIDGADNLTERELSTVVALKAGRIVDENGEAVEGAVVKIYIYDELIGRYSPWEAEAFGQVNPQTTRKDGTYRLLLPSGKYYLEVKAPSKKKVRTTIFETDFSTPFNFEFKLQASLVPTFPGLDFLSIFETETVDVEGFIQSRENRQEDTGAQSLLGKTLPASFSGGNQLLGRLSVLTLFSSWDPRTSDQLRELEKLSEENEGINVMGVALQESTSKIETIKKIGSYELDLVADPDGILVEPLQVQSLPTTFFFDRSGVISNFVVGYQNKEELLERILD